jgi:hypothetical protein
MLGIFGKTQTASVAELIAKKKYAKAIELIKEQLVRRRRDPRLRLQLADVLALAGKKNDAIALLSEISDDYALSGAAAKAIALLKKIQALAPGRADVEERLAYLISQQERPAPDPWARSQSMGVIHPEPPSGPGASSGAFPGDMEEISAGDSFEIGMAAEPSGEPRAVGAATPPQPMDETPLLESIPSATHADDESFSLDAGDETSSTGPVEKQTGGDEVEELSNDELQDELMSLIEDVFTGQKPLETSPLAALPVVETPLFRDFTCEELVDVIRALELRVFAPGAIIVTEDEPGASLLVLTSGTVLAHVRDTNGRNVRIRQLQEGDFFGEISLLKGGRRTATITAASHCELLEINREVFGTISQKHPRVWATDEIFRLLNPDDS